MVGDISFITAATANCRSPRDQGASTNRLRRFMSVQTNTIKGSLSARLGVHVVDTDDVLVYRWHCFIRISHALIVLKYMIIINLIIRSLFVVEIDTAIEHVF